LNGKKTKKAAERSGKNGIRPLIKKGIFNNRSGILPWKAISLAHGNQKSKASPVKNPLNKRKPINSKGTKIKNKDNI